MIRYLFVLTLSACTLSPLMAADDKKDEAGFVPMFNGKDLSGWVNVNCHPDTFFVKDGMLITTGKPTGFIRTAKQYENFIAEFEWMHVPPKPDAVGNSGFFVWADPLPGVGSPFTRGIEVQVLVNLTYTDKKSGAVTASSHGDIFPIQGSVCIPDRPHPSGGSRCIPSENRAKGANEWNHYRIEAKDGVIKLAVNGKVVSGVSKSSPRKGYLALESEGSECRFRNLKIKELPTSNPEAKEIASVDEGFNRLFSGLDLLGWKTNNQGWKVSDGVYSATKPTHLKLEQGTSKCEFLCDWKLPASAAQEWTIEAGGQAIQVKLPEGKKAGTWTRLKLELKAAKDAPKEEEPITIKAPEGLDLRNAYFREIKLKQE